MTRQGSPGERHVECVGFLSYSVLRFFSSFRKGKGCEILLLHYAIVIFVYCAFETHFSFSVKKPFEDSEQTCRYMASKVFKILYRQYKTCTVMHCNSISPISFKQGDSARTVKSHILTSPFKRTGKAVCSLKTQSEEHLASLCVYKNHYLAL